MTDTSVSSLDDPRLDLSKALYNLSLNGIEIPKGYGETTPSTSFSSCVHDWSSPDTPCTASKLPPSTTTTTTTIISSDTEADAIEVTLQQQPQQHDDHRNNGTEEQDESSLINSFSLASGSIRSNQLYPQDSNYYLCCSSSSPVIPTTPHRMDTFCGAAGALPISLMFCGGGGDGETSVIHYSGSTAKGSPHDTTQATPTPPQLLHHRMMNLQSRKSKLTSLKRNLHPFLEDPSHTAAMNATNPNNNNNIAASQSFDLQQLQGYNHHHPSPERYGCHGFCTKPSTPKPSPACIKLQLEEQDNQGYDSDPEECRTVATQLDTVLKDHSSRQLFPRVLHQSSTIAEFLNERFTMIQHTSCRSVAVHLWMERGQRIGDQYILPRLCWKPIVVEDNKNNNGRLQWMDLVHISRVLPVSSIDRNVHPLPLKNRFFTIESSAHNHPVLFLEAHSQADVVHYVHWLKRTVARLATLLYTKDNQLLDEFFVPEDLIKQAWV